MPPTRTRPPTRFSPVLIGIWVCAVMVLFVLNGWHYDFHALTLGILLVFGCALIVGAWYFMTLWLRERDRTEELLRQSRERCSSVVENSLTGIFIGQDGLIRFSNERFATTHGFTPEEIVGKYEFDLVHPDERAALKAIADRLYSGELQDHTYELRCLTRDGRTIWVQRRSRRILHDGRPALLGNEIDITEQKLAQAKVGEANEQIQRLLGRLVRQQEQDRREIAAEIQEDFAQSLNAIKLRVESLFARPQGQDGRVAPDSLAPLVADVQQTMRSIRRLARKLYPMAVDAFGIVAALRWLFDSQMESLPEFRIQYHLDVEEALVPRDLKVAAFRMIEKILADAVLKEPAGSLKAYLQGFGSHAILAIKIEGRPGEANTAPDSPLDESLEVADFRTRIESCGGRFSLRARPEATRLWASWPIPSRKQNPPRAPAQHRPGQEAASGS
jgi:PAS domain S-box-containing protein